MGPSILIDKSAIQSFSYEEMTALYRHYDVVVCPTLIAEIQADLAKHPATPDEDKKKVSYLAYQASGIGARTIVRFENLLLQNMAGSNFPLGPQIPRFDGKHVRGRDGSHGVHFDETEEELLLKRWARQKFTIEDQASAERWRAQLAGLDLERLKKELQLEGDENWRANSLLEVAQTVDQVNGPFDIEGIKSIEIVMERHKFSDTSRNFIRDRYEKMGKIPFSQFAPYAHFCNRLTLIYLIGLKTNLISTSKKGKTAVDYQYLFYAPFCTVFCSGDNFHGAIAPTVLRPDQRYFDARALKADLAILSSCYNNMTEDEKKWYARNMGSRPPRIQDSLTVRLWDEVARPWEMGSGNRVVDMSPEEQAELLRKIKEMSPFED